MDAFEILAEVALGIAGFGSIAIVLGRDEAGWLPSDLFRTSALFLSSLGALLLALLTIGLDASGLPEQTVWRGASAALIVHYVCGGVFMRLQRRRLLEPSLWFGPALMGTVGLAAALIVGAQLANLLRLGIEPGAAPPYFGIVGLLIFACIMLLRIVFVRPGGADPTAGTPRSD